LWLIEIHDFYTCENQFSLVIFLRNRQWKCTIFTGSFLGKSPVKIDFHTQFLSWASQFLSTSVL